MGKNLPLRCIRIIIDKSLYNCLSSLSSTPSLSPRAFTHSTIATQKNSTMLASRFARAVSPTLLLLPRVSLFDPCLISYRFREALPSPDFPNSDSQLRQHSSDMPQQVRREERRKLRARSLVLIWVSHISLPSDRSPRLNVQEMLIKTLRHHQLGSSCNGRETATDNREFRRLVTTHTAHLLSD